MKKKSKKRIPQDVKPWIRVKDKNDDVFSMPAKQTTRWISGERRNWETRVLNAAIKIEKNLILLKSCTEFSAWRWWLQHQKVMHRLHTANKVNAIAKYKNYCILSGRARTFNRCLYIARHSFRRLSGVGLLSGIIK